MSHQPSFLKLGIGFGIATGILFVIAKAAGKPSRKELPEGPPIAERTIEVTGVVTYIVKKLGNGFFRILAYSPGTEKLGTENELAEFTFGPDGPHFIWGDGEVLERLRNIDMPRFPKDLFA